MSKEDKNLVAYCALYCGDCFNYQGKIADLARDLRKELRAARFDKAAPGLSKFFKDFKDYEVCYRVLGSMVRLRCKRSCIDGGGNPSCKIRICAKRGDLRGCWECAEFETCKKLDFLKPIHKDANIKNIKNIRKQGLDSFIKGKRLW